MQKPGARAAFERPKKNCAAGFPPNLENPKEDQRFQSSSCPRHSRGTAWPMEKNYFERTGKRYEGKVREITQTILNCCQNVIPINTLESLYAAKTCIMPSKCWWIAFQPTNLFGNHFEPTVPEGHPEILGPLQLRMQGTMHFSHAAFARLFKIVLILQDPL